MGEQQRARGEPVLDLGARDPRTQQLPPRHDAVLARRDSPDHLVGCPIPVRHHRP
jgi:hypothetical protein